MSITMFAPTYDVESCIKEIRECLEKGWTGLGYKTLIFEDEWKKYTGLENAQFLTTGTAALNLAVETMKEFYGWQDGDEIISTPLTFVATNNCILFSKLKPVFADVDDTLCLDPYDVEKKITNKTRAIIFVGLGGNVGHLEAISTICKKNKLKLILDGAHMAGTRWNGKHIGYNADATIFSFHVTKNLSLAEGGMLCFKEKELENITRKKQFNGIDKTHAPKSSEKLNKWEYDVKYLADAYNGNSIIASIGIAQLPHLDIENERRREICKIYDSFFSNCKKIKLVTIPDGCESSRWLYQLIVEDRDELLNYMAKNGVECGIHYPDNTLYWMYADQYGICKNSLYLSNHLISLPLHLKLTNDDVIYIASLIKNFYGDL